MDNDIISNKLACELIEIQKKELHTDIVKMFINLSLLIDCHKLSFINNFIFITIKVQCVVIKSPPLMYQDVNFKSTFTKLYFREKVAENKHIKIKYIMIKSRGLF